MAPPHKAVRLLEEKTVIFFICLCPEHSTGPSTELQSKFAELKQIHEPSPREQLSFYVLVLFSMCMSGQTGHLSLQRLAKQ